MPYTFALKIGHQNIHGGGNIKLENDTLIDKITKHYIFGCQETWLGKDDTCPDIRGYSQFRSERKKHAKSKRHAGGSVIYVKRCILGGITKLSSRSNSHGDVIWLKLDKNFFGLDENIILCYLYIVPDAKKECFDILTDELDKYQSKGLITILGDVNSRIGTRVIKHFSVEVNGEQPDIQSLYVPLRKNKDKIINSNGRKLCNIASDYELLPANGSIIGDFQGEFTCISWNGLSTNDLLLFHRSLLHRIQYFKIAGSWDWYSDHKSVSLSIRVKISNKHKRQDDLWKDIIKPKINWDLQSIENFKSMLSNTENTDKINQFCETHFTSAEQAANSFTKIIKGIISDVFPNSTSKRNNTLRKHRRDNYSENVQAAKRCFKKSQKLFNRRKHDVTRRQQFIRDRRKYKKAIYLNKKLQKTSKINRLANLESTDPKVFWKELKSILSPNNDATELIEKSEWFEHFNKLLNAESAKNQDMGFLDYVKNSLPYLELFSDDVEGLNRSISQTEIESSTKDIKIGKSAHFDNIGNEILKYGLDQLKRPLAHLYNIVINKGEFPSLWSDGLIVPLHKKDDRLDTNNYRGIIISSCLGKLFLRIITKRINDFMDQHHKWSSRQCGFKKDHRTEDNLFILNTIFEKYVKVEKKKVYVAFIDFSKFFDKINRHIMLYKLLKYGISGKIYNIIKSVYSKTSFAIKIGGKISPDFQAVNGLKQGCCLSPILSNIFQNDLHTIFDTDCEPLSIGSTVLNSISWADDLILMSLSKAGLQKCLNKLAIYCQKWGLEVNVDKTKSMVFSNKYAQETFFYEGEPLEQVKTFRYLGFLLSYNTNISSVMNDRIEKANKVSNMILRAIKSDKNVSTKLALSIYDKQVSPVMLYGCPIWSVPNNGNLLYLENQPEHINTRKRINDVFMNINGDKLPFVYARRVGKYSQAHNRSIIIKMKYYEDKQSLLRLNHPNYKFSNFIQPNYSDISKRQLDYCKKSLNLSKFTSNTAVQYELGRSLIDFKAYALAIKYWLRLTTGTENRILNESYAYAFNQKHEWVQGIQSLLNNNGFGDVWLNPGKVNPKTFHIKFKQRLVDQSQQVILSKINQESKFGFLRTTLKEEEPFQCQRYIHIIKNPDIREIFTKLRINMSKLEASKVLINKSETNGFCACCNLNKIESTQHTIFECPKFESIRLHSYNNILKCDPDFNVISKSTEKLMLYVLSLECPKICINECCKLVATIYRERIKQETE